MTQSLKVLLFEPLKTIMLSSTTQWIPSFVAALGYNLDILSLAPVSIKNPGLKSYIRVTGFNDLLEIRWLCDHERRAQSLHDFKFPWLQKHRRCYGKVLCIVLLCHLIFHKPFRRLAPIISSIAIFVYPGDRRVSASVLTSFLPRIGFLVLQDPDTSQRRGTLALP
jgi:hypothetical protein